METDRYVAISKGEKSVVVDIPAGSEVAHIWGGRHFRLAELAALAWNREETKASSGERL